MLSEVSQEDTAVALRDVGNVQVCLVRGGVGVEDMRRIGDRYRALARRHRTGVVGLSIICRGTPVAGRLALAEARAFLGELQESIHLIGVVIEEHGVAAQMLSSVVRGLNVFNRHKRLTVVTTVDQGIEQIAPHLQGVGGADPAITLQRTIQEMRNPGS